MYVYTYVRAKSLQSCLTPCDAMDCSSPGSSVYGILQARILEWVAMPSSRVSSWPRDRTCVSFDSSIAGGFFNSWATREIPYMCTYTHAYEVWCPEALLRPRNTLKLVSREYKKDFCSCLRILVIFNWMNLRSSFKEYWSQTEFDSLKPWKLSSPPPGKLFKIRSSTPLPSAVCSKMISLSLFSDDYLLGMEERPWEEEWNSSVDWEVTVFKQTK